MASYRVAHSSLVRAALAGTASLVLLLALPGGPAFARIGVTSATDGDPLGKPPSANERVLRIGIDVQANELVTTAANDRAHLVFLDGTSITVGPNARLTLDKFVYDPATQKGELALTATKGVFRIVGGKISKTNAITVTTPSSTIGVRGGISHLAVESIETRAAFVFGIRLSITAGGQTKTIFRPGFQSTTHFGGLPGTPVVIPHGVLAGDLSALEGTSRGNSGGNADQRAQASGFSALNSGQGPGLGFTPPQPIPPGVTNAATNSVSGANTQVQPGDSTQKAASQMPAATTTLNGYAAGLIVNNNGESSQTRLPVPGNPTDMSIATGPSTGQPNSNVRGTLIIRQYNAVNTLELGGTPTSAAFVDNKNFVMVTTDDPSRKSTVQVGSQTFNTTNSSALVTAGAPPPGCTCDYLTWGLWATEITYGPGFRNGQSDSVPIAPFVAGTLTTAMQMPQTGSATYNGTMLGVARTGSSSPYLATGTYNSTWGFASRTGTFNASFDGTNYSGSAAAVAGSGGTTFAGSFSGGGRNGTLSGAFFSAPSDAAKYQAGAFAIKGSESSYKAAGVFAGQR